MSYTPPKQWRHGDQPDGAEMQKYSDGLNFLNAILGGQQLNFAVPFSRMEDAQEYWLVHKRRYLIYRSTGKIHDPTGANEPISLSNPEEINIYDLDQIIWMTPGKLYRVVGCSVCMEDARGW